ncbi:hypothetical protein NQ318_009864 [Aromia moschata]|uniref:Uncharacterized protein n=1 Tax=Aromia moschata TaxID=1265417 RepID=A0AAV8X2Q6_9CUCU|nr:hypothetical protein NQ318_009864 [Aromia moschata]
MLANVADDPTFIKLIITGDKTWVYEFEVETAQQSSEWRAKNVSKPKKTRQSRSKIKVMLIVFSSITVVWFTMNSFRGSNVSDDLAELSPKMYQKLLLSITVRLINNT